MPKRAYILVREAHVNGLSDVCGLSSRLHNVSGRIGTFQEAEWAQAEMHRQFRNEIYNIYTIIPITRVMLEPLDALTPLPSETPTPRPTSSTTRAVPPLNPELLEQLTEEARRQQGQDSPDREPEDLPF